MPYSDIRKLPIPYRRWFIDRLVSEFEKKKEAYQEAQPRGQQRREVPMGEMADLSFSKLLSSE